MKRLKWMGIGVIFIGVLMIGLLAPGRVLRWQDRKRESQIQFETAEEVKLNGDESFALVDKLKLFSGCDKNAQVAELDISNSYVGKYESQMDQLVEQEYRKLADLELMSPMNGTAGMESGKNPEFMDRLIEKRIFYVFDIRNPGHSMFVWEYMLFDSTGGIEILNLDQQSGKLLGFAHIDDGWNTDITYPVSDTYLLECMERFLEYLGLSENPAEITLNWENSPKYVLRVDGEIEIQEGLNEAYLDERNVEEMMSGFWRSMLLFSLEDSEGTFDYRVLNGENGYAFGMNKIF